MPEITTSGGRRFHLQSGETILDAALRQDVALEYSCRTGRCATCRAKVRSGSTAPLHDEPGLSSSERDNGWVLTCVRTTDSDLELEVHDLGAVKMHPVRTLPCRVSALERLALNVLKVVLRLPALAAFDYHPGQHIDVIGPGGVTRSYSIANAPCAAGTLELHIRELPGGEMSKYWFSQARQDDLLRLRGPRGTFFLREVEGLDLVFLATGTGIAPVKAMLEGLAADVVRPRPRSITLYWGARVAQELYWRPDAVGIAHRFVPVLSRAQVSWGGRRGHVQQQFLADSVGLSNAVVHACGSPAMVDDARLMLEEAGLPTGNFHSDAFVPSGETR